MSSWFFFAFLSLSLSPPIAIPRSLAKGRVSCVCVLILLVNFQEFPHSYHSIRGLLQKVDGPPSRQHGGRQGRPATLIALLLPSAAGLDFLQHLASPFMQGILHLCLRGTEKGSQGHWWSDVKWLDANKKKLDRPSAFGKHRGPTNWIQLVRKEHPWVIHGWMILDHLSCWADGSFFHYWSSTWV